MGDPLTDPIRLAAKLIIKHLTEKDYLFSVKTGGYDWDVYNFFAGKLQGHIAFRLEDDAVHLGAIEPGYHTEAEMKKLIQAFTGVQDV